MKAKVELLGHVVDSVGASVDLSNVEATRMEKVSTTTTELRIFLGLAKYYRPFVKNCADTCAALHEQTSGKGPI